MCNRKNAQKFQRIISTHFEQMKQGQRKLYSKLKRNTDRLTEAILKV
jgi:hypothetical protein